MSKDLFRFKHRPFAAAADVVNFVPNESMENALTSVISGVERTAGTGVVIGPAGIGKTMFCEELAKRLQHSHEIVLLATSRLCTRRALLQNILFELRLPFRESEEGELRLSLLEHLKSPESGTDGMLLIVDEAHTMPLRLLEEIRGLTNISRGGQARVQLVLVGTQLLDERLTNPKMDGFTQRIATRAYLHPLNREENRRYISQQWHQASADGAPLALDESAVEAVHTATQGVPRLINQLVDHTLMLANVRLAREIGVELIEEAWSDLQQMPTPWQVNYKEPELGVTQSQTIIEFGTLGDDDASTLDAGTDEATVTQTAIDSLSAIDELTQIAADIDEEELTLAEEEESWQSTGDHVAADKPESSLLEPEPLMIEQPPELSDEKEAEFELVEDPEDVTELEPLAHESEQVEADHSPTAELEPELEPEPPKAIDPFADDDFEVEETVAVQREIAADLPSETSSVTVDPPATVAETESAPAVEFDDIEKQDQNATQAWSAHATVAPLTSDESTTERPLEGIESDTTPAAPSNQELPSFIAPQGDWTGIEPNDDHRGENSILSSLPQGLEDLPSSDHLFLNDDVSHTQDSDEITGHLSNHDLDDLRADLLPRPHEIAPAPTAPQPPLDPPTIVPPSAPTNAASNDSDESATAPTSPKDMIVVDNPIPPAALRVVGSTPSADAVSAGGTGSAYREDYHTLLNRLRGSANS